MSSHSLLSPEVVAALDDGAVLLTGTSRLARALGYAFNRHKQNAGETAWQSPGISPMGRWLQALWQNELCFLPQISNNAVLLSRTQEEAVWERVIGDWCIRKDRTIMQVAAAAEIAQSAYALLHGWQLPTPTLDEHPTDDILAFLEWLKAFESWCAANGRISPSLLPGKTADAFRQNVLRAPSVVLLAGFEEDTAAHRALLATMEELGTRIEHIPVPEQIPNVRVAECTAPEHEIEVCAMWIREHLEANPEKTIGIVVPDLSQRRTHIARAFEDVLSPESLLPGAPPQRHINFSLGAPLAEYPLVAAALHALDFLKNEIELNQLGSLLRSPYLGDGDAEANERALLDVQLRRLGDRAVRLPWLIEQAGERAKGRSHHAPGLASRLSRLQPIVDRLPARASPVAWAQSFRDTLGELGWPRGRTLDSTEHQLREKWNALLDTFAGLEAIIEPLTLSSALARLRRLAAGITFQPESDAAPVQVMGLLEATGAQFDALWVLGLTDTQLPGSPHPHPLLPLDIQRKHHLPHSSSNRELDFARARLNALVKAAPEVVLSFPRMEEDRENLPSPLLHPYRDRQVDVSSSGFATYTKRLRGTVELETIEDASAPGLAEGHRTGGGFGVLKSQADCPFQAFGKYRLHAQELEEPQDGIDAKTLGSIVHGALEGLWKEIKSQETLQNLAPERIHDLISRVTAEAIDKAAATRPGTFKPALKALQQGSTERLLRGWIDLERTRAPFTAVATEKVVSDQTIGPLTLRKLVVDRIDELEEDGSHVIIDYKTGRGHSRNAWLGHRLEEPQLPLYASLSEGEIGGLMFGNVRGDGPGWSGHTRAGGVFSTQAAYPSGDRKSDWERLAPDWSALLSAWRIDLEALAIQYVEGDARVDPKNPRTTCTYCHLKAACRIAEKTEQAGGEIIGMLEDDDG